MPTMIVAHKSSLVMFILLGLLTFVYHLGFDIRQLRGLEPLPAFEFLHMALLFCGVVWWLRAETQTSPVTDIYCAGLLVSTGWPIIIPYHLLKTRGLKGLLPLFALIATFVFAKILAAVIYLAISGFTSE